MIRNISPATLVATAIVSLAIGFGGASLMPSGAHVIEPIVDANAWEEVSPATLMTEQVGYTTPAHAATCDPWNISDVAMEEVLDEMIRRGWRPPTQGDAIALLDRAQTISLSATDPYAPMPSRRTWSPSDSQQDDSHVEDVAIAEPTIAAEPESAPPEEKPEPPPA